MKIGNRISEALSLTIAMLICLPLLVGCESTPLAEESTQQTAAREASPAEDQVAAKQEKKITAADDSHQPAQASPAPDRKQMQVGTQPVADAGSDAAQKKGADETAAPGKLEVDRTRHDFGLVEPGSSNATTFTLTNSGKGPLEIEKPRSSCGCTVPELKKKVLEPGESIDMVVNFKAKTYAGKASNWVEIKPKSPSKPEKLRVSLAAEVVKYLNATPARMSLEVREGGEPARLVIESADQSEFAILGISATGQVVSADIDTSVRKSRHEITLDVDQEKLRKTQRGNITVRVDHEKLKSVNVYFSAKFAFAARPTTRSIRNVGPGQTRRSNVVIVSNFNEPFELGEVTSKEGHISIVSRQKTDDGYRIEFDFTVPEEKTSGYVMDFLNVAIKDRESEKIEVRCYAMVSTQSARGAAGRQGSAQ